MKWYLSILLAVLLVENGLTRLTPDYIHPCPADNNPCILQSAIEALPRFTKGIPELGVPSLDPFYIEKLTIPLQGLKISFYQGKVTGFRKAIIDNIVSNVQKQKFVLDFHSNVTLKGGYEASGRILTFPVDGEGDVKIKITNLRMKVTLYTHMVQDENGVQHFGVKNHKYTCDYGDKTTYNMTNLFKENPAFGQTVLTFMNQNWRLIAEEFGKPVIDYAVELAVRAIEKFFLAVPYQELIDGPISFEEQMGAQLTQFQ